MPWAPPVGIPIPSFGITEEVSMYLDPAYTWDYGSGPEPYRTANGLPYSYYVDKTAPGATDTGNTYGSPATPRLTWPYPLAAGACVQIHGGNYTFTNSAGSKMAMGGTGTAELPIFFYGTSSTEASMPKITTGECYVYGDYLIVEKIRFGAGSGVNTSVATRPLLKGAPVLNVCVRDCYLRGTGASSGSGAFGTGGSSGASAENYTDNYVILRNVISDYGDWQAASENDATGIIAGQFATNVWICDNEVYHMGGDGCRLGADQGDDPSGGFYYVGRNHFHDNRENGLDVKQAIDSVISENVMHGFASSSSSAGEAIVIHYSPDNIWFLNNVIYDCVDGIVSTGVGTDCYIVGNLLYNCSNRGMYLDRGGGTFHVENNTISDCANGIVSTGTVAAIHMKNNLIADITDTVSGFHLNLTNSTAAMASDSINTLFYQAASGDVRIKWAATTYTSMATWQSATSKGANSVNSNPVFEGALDFRLQSSSPAIGAATASSLDAIFVADFGVTMEVDYYGNARPTDGSWDIGAYEFVPIADLNITTLNATTLTVG